MFVQPISQIRSLLARAVFAVRKRRSLALLERHQRNAAEEQRVRQVETQLFFDAELLAAAARHTDLHFGKRISRQLLASVAALLIAGQTLPADATESTQTETIPTSRDGESGQVSLQERIEDWIKDLLVILDDPGDDPEGGERK
jgi:hypothetical protein